MICPLLELCDVIDDAMDTFTTKDRPIRREAIETQPPQGLSGTITTYTVTRIGHYLTSLAYRLDRLTNETDCPPDLIDSVGNLIRDMAQNLSKIKWKSKEVLGAAVYNPAAIEKLRGLMMGGRVE